MEYNRIEVQRSLRYVSRPAIQENPILVYLLHGYGQLAYYFLHKVADILPNEVHFVAPEGMHRFYLNGTAGRVGASWMTKEGREIDILENSKALDTLHSHLVETIQPRKIAVIGFSQGGATAARWIGNGQLKVDLNLTWASVYPPDLTPESNTMYATQNTFVLGTEDPYFNEEARDFTIQQYKEMGFETITFEGKHELNIRILEDQIKKLIES